MKLFIFLLGLAVASATITITPTTKDTTVLHSYKDVGKSFIYKYEAFLNTTLPQSGVEFVGQKIICDVELNVLTSEIIHMNLTNILVQEVNGTYNATLKEKNILYPVNISVWNSSLTQNYTRELRNPVTFQYVNGKILKVFANRTDAEWVVNMKKGIMNMLVLQLENDNVFTKKEEGISGTCFTEYFVEERHTKDNIKVFNVTKVRDLTKCTEVPLFTFKTVDKKECRECDKEVTQPIKAIATFKYNVTGERNRFFIESCTSTASYVMTPSIDMDKGSYAVFQNQSLFLKEVKSKEIKLEEDLKDFGSIMFIFPEIVQENNNDEYNMTLKKIEYFLNLLVRDTLTKFDLDTPSHFMHLVRSLRECNITQLRQVWKFTQNNITRDWVVKALPYVNKTEMTLLVKEMFFNRTINVTKWHAKEILVSMGALQNPTVDMIQNIRDICEMELLKEPITDDMPRENITRNIALRRACFIAMGNMINRFRKIEKFVPTTLVRSLTDCEETYANPQLNPSIVNEDTYEMLMQFRERQVRLQCVEAMGNAGLADHIDILREHVQEHVESQQVPIDVRLGAITALRRVGREQTKKVLSILMSVLKNPLEDTEVRIVAYLTMVECNLSPAMLTLITDECNKWTNREVRSFVYTHLKNLAKSTDPSEKRLATAARYAVLNLRPFNVTFQRSQNRRMEFFTDDKKFGVNCELNTVFGTQNIIPRRINGKCGVGINGQFVDLTELNIHTDSLNDVLDRIFGKYGSWGKRKSIFDLMKERRTQESTDHTKLELVNIKKKVDPYTKQTYRHGSAQLKMFDNEMLYMTLDEKFFNDLMDEGKLSTKMVDIEMELLKPQRFNITKVNMFENHQQFPTVMGLPLSLNDTVGSTVRLQVNTTFVAQPSLQDVKHTELIAKVNVTPEVVVVSTRAFGCHNPLIKLATENNVTVNFTLPLTTKLTLDYDMKKFSLEVDQTKKDRVDILNIKNNITLIQEKTLTAKTQIFKKNVTVINGTQTGLKINTTMCFQPYPDSGKICLNITTFQPKRRNGPEMQFRGPAVIEVFGVQGTYRPDKIVLEYEPKEVQQWDNGVKHCLLKLRFTGDKKRYSFVERFVTLDVELEDRRPTRLNVQDDLFTLTGKMKRSDIPDWIAKIRGTQTANENIEVDCQWGMPKEHDIIINKTEKRIQREYYVKFVSDRWILPTQTVHNMTLIWADVPHWLATVGETYRTYAPMMKQFIVHRFTPFDITVEPKQSWLENSYGICFKSKSNDTMDVIFVMPNQEITVRNVTLPVHTDFIKKPLPLMLNAIMRPNITIIPLPKTCSINSTGIRTFDNITVNYTLPGSCPHVLVKDCSTDERFMVLVQNVTLREEPNTVVTGLKSIVYVSKRKFELITKLDTDQRTKILEVKVDGKKYLESLNGQQEVEIEITKTNTTLRRNTTHLSLISGQGFTVVLSRFDLKVNVSQRHWNTTCGLCGNNDDVKASELRTPWTRKPTHVKNDTKFGISWVVPGDDCRDPECKLKKYVSFPLARIEQEEVMIGESKAACFSKEPVFYCPEECEPVPMNEVFLNSNYEPKKKTVKIDFSCFKTSNPTVAYITMRDQSFTNKPTDITREVEIPQRCNCLHTCLEANRLF